MTDERRELWERYFEHLSDMVGLRDWLVFISDEHPPAQDRLGVVGADVDCIYGKKVARVRLAADWDDMEPEHQRLYAIHELVHPHFAMPDLFVNNLLHDLCSPREFTQHDQTYSYLMELGIDAIAQVLAPMMPVPGDVLPELAPPKEDKPDDKAA